MDVSVVLGGVVGRRLFWTVIHGLCSFRRSGVAGIGGRNRWVGVICSGIGGVLSVVGVVEASAVVGEGWVGGGNAVGGAV